MVSRRSTDAVGSGGRQWSRWTRDHAAGLSRTPETVAPIIRPPETDPATDVHVWDTWLLRNRKGEIASLNGWRVVFSLTAPADLLPGKRHDVARIGYFYSRDGREWHHGGTVFEGDALGQRQWAGSAIYDDGDVYLFYTAAGTENDDKLTYNQRLAAATGGTVTATDTTFRLEGHWDHHELLTPDGEWYETEAQSRGMIYTFRDPWFFEDPETGTTTLLFEANIPVPEDSTACSGEATQQEFNGAVGVAVSESGDPLSWELCPPILDSICVNQELERPHVIPWDDRYYLFVSSHVHTFAPGLSGFDGLYGFVADSLRGQYRPLNDTGLVATNPASAPFQAYSWMVFPHRQELLVQSFFNYYDFDEPSLDAIAHLPEDEQLRRFGGTLAPTLRVGVDADRTHVRGTLDHWHIPIPDEELPPLDATRFEPGDPELRDDGDGQVTRGYGYPDHEQDDEPA